MTFNYFYLRLLALIFCRLMLALNNGGLVKDPSKPGGFILNMTAFVCVYNHSNIWILIRLDLTAALVVYCFL